MRVKIFSLGITYKVMPEELEVQINEWLTENPGTTIEERSVATTSGTNIQGVEFINITIVVWYRPHDVRSS